MLANGIFDDINEVLIHKSPQIKLVFEIRKRLGSAQHPMENQRPSRLSLSAVADRDTQEISVF
jgi:hypothetical protein